MPAPVEYLEAAKIEEVASQMEADGYTVTRQHRNGANVYDLVATKAEEKIAVEVKARSALREATGQVRELRERAYSEGFTEFRLVITNPPHETRVEIDGLDDQLSRYFSSHLPETLSSLSKSTRATGVSSVEIDAVHVSADGVSVIGTGIVQVRLEDDMGATPADAGWTIDFPFTFKVMLDHTLTLASVTGLAVDTSSFHDLAT